MTSQVCDRPIEEFSSWDDVSVGDHLIFIDLTSSNSALVVIEFTGIEGEQGTWRQVRGNILEDPKEDYGNNTTWSDYIFGMENSNSIFSGGRFGWARVIKQYKYDPTQAGDLEDDV